MTPATPIIIVTKGRHDMLAMTFASLYTMLSATSAGRYRIYHGWQDEQSPYVQSYAASQARLLINSLSGVSIVDHQLQGSVAASRAALIEWALLDAPGISNVLMFDGDCVFHNNPFQSANVRGNQGVTGWSHTDLENSRGFADYDGGGILYDTREYLDKFGHLPHCEHASPFHRYVSAQDMDHVSTQACWSVEALTAKDPEDGKSVLDVWHAWPKGVRSYDVEGCRRIARLGYPIKIVGCEHMTINMYALPDAVEGNWNADAAHEGKIT